MSTGPRPLVLVISQVYLPDPASVGQHMADVAEAMVRRGYDVRVLTSSRGYENPRARYARSEWRAGVDVVRLPFSSFGKKSLARRILAQLLFLMQATVRGLMARRLAGIVVSTAPPMGPLAAAAIGWVRRVPITYWLMDLNPDQAVALGIVTERNPLVRGMRWINRVVFRRAAEVVLLDRYMEERVGRQYDVAGRVTVLPPWAHDEALADVQREANPFVAQHHLTGRLVVMYSGNHSLASPVTTLVQAALQLRNDQRFRFVFIGSGAGKQEVDHAIAAHRPANVLSLPYQPLEHIGYSLSAADVHVVTHGDGMVGMIHPCKIYGAMAAGRPVLFVGPRTSPAANLVQQHQIGWRVAAGDVSGMVTLLRRVADMPSAALEVLGHRGRDAVRQHYSKRHLAGAFCDLVERSIRQTAGTRREAIPRLRRGTVEPAGSDGA